MPKPLGKGKKGPLGGVAACSVVSRWGLFPAGSFQGNPRPGHGLQLEQEHGGTTLPALATLGHSLLSFPKPEVMVYSLLDQGGQTLARSTTTVLAGRGCQRFLVPPHSEQDRCQVGLGCVQPSPKKPPRKRLHAVSGGPI